MMPLLFHFGVELLRGQKAIPPPVEVSRQAAKQKVEIVEEKKWKKKGKRRKETMEDRVRRIVERVFNAPFPKCRPDWLKNHKTGRNLELDMFNPTLKLAVEYNGRQHKEFIKEWMDAEGFEDQQWRDREKAILCQKNGVTLITIDARKVNIEDVEAYLRQEISRGTITSLLKAV